MLGLTPVDFSRKPSITMQALQLMVKMTAGFGILKDQYQPLMIFINLFKKYLRRTKYVSGTVLHSKTLRVQKEINFCVCQVVYVSVAWIQGELETSALSQEAGP